MARWITRWLLTAAAALAAFAAVAQTAPRSYAVVSELAREVTFVAFQESTGTRLSANLQNRIKIPEGALDKAVLLTARQALNKAEPGAPVWLVAPLETDLFDGIALAGEGGTLKIPDDLAAALKQRGSTHLLVLSRYRADARIKVAFGHTGTGQLEGMGFYVDRLQPMRDLNSGMTTNGFIAPFIYLRATLADASSGQVLGVRTVAESAAYVNIRSDVPSTQAYDAMTPAEKVKILANLITTQIGGVIPPLLGR